MVSAYLYIYIERERESYSWPELYNPILIYQDTSMLRWSLKLNSMYMHVSRLIHYVIQFGFEVEPALLIASYALPNCDPISHADLF